MELRLFLATWIAFSSVAVYANEKCPYYFDKKSKVMLVNQYAAITDQDVVDQLVRELEENAGYVLTDKSELVTPYTLSYAIEADGDARKIKPAITIIYRSDFGNSERMIMKTKRVRDHRDRISALQKLVTSAVNQVPICPTWRREHLGIGRHTSQN